ncbi:hypothetical protein F66182_10062, partial [Fusarium sp. NRRL 66182]
NAHSSIAAPSLVPAAIIQAALILFTSLAAVPALVLAVLIGIVFVVAHDAVPLIPSPTQAGNLAAFDSTQSMSRVAATVLHTNRISPRPPARFTHPLQSIRRQTLV